MKEIKFGRWGTVLKDHRQGEQSDDLHDSQLPSEKGFPNNINALMSGKGFLLFDEEFSFVPMLREYVSQIQAKFCCGKCITGIKGLEVVVAPHLGPDDAGRGDRNRTWCPVPHGGHP